MRDGLILSTASLLSFASIASAAPVAKNPLQPAATEQGWVLHQRHVSLKALRVYITGTAIKVDGQAHSWGVISKAPKWEAICYSRASKTQCTLPYATWSKIGFSVIEWLDGIAGPPASCVKETSTFHNHPVELCRWRGPTQKIDVLSEAQMGPKESEFTMISSTLVKLNDKELQLLEHFYKLPMQNGMLLLLGSSSARTPMLNTVVIKQQPLEKSTFQLTGFKSVPSQADVWIDASDRAKIDDLGEMFSAPGR